jgi:hypothetical protein
MIARECLALGANKNGAFSLPYDRRRLVLFEHRNKGREYKKMAGVFSRYRYAKIF